jgi:spore coat polysaccharide biosynthesis protein SpsF (cytidylyltransferase family)
MSSTRLPGKVMLDLAGKPVIAQVFHQLSFSKRISKTVLATSTKEDDNILIEWAEKSKTPFYRGSIDNVLERFYKGAKYFNADIIVRVTGDCPLIDPEIIDLMLDKFIESDLDYFTNNNPPTFPDGLDVEIFSLVSFEKVYRLAKLPSELEHVTPFYKTRNNIFKAENYLCVKDLQNYRWTLDTKEDYELIKIIYSNLFKENSFISYKDVLKLFDSEKELNKINQHINRNEGYISSLEKDNDIKPDGIN